MNQILSLTFWIIGFLYSMFLGSTLYIRDVHGVQWPNVPNISIILKTSQWILNFSGGFVGWVILGYFLNKFDLPYNIKFPSEFNIQDIILGLTMFYGLNGKLPYFLMQAPEKIAKLIRG